MTDGAYFSVWSSFLDAVIADIAGFLQSRLDFRSSVAYSWITRQRIKQSGQDLPFATIADDRGARMAC